MCNNILIFYVSFRYFVEFSKPDKLRPIPEGTVKVFFDITVGDNAGEYDIEFNFENESLKHRMDSTMREDMFQVSTTVAVIDANTISHFVELDRPRSRKQAQDQAAVALGNGI